MDAFKFAGSDDDEIIDGDVGPVSGPVSGTGKGKESKQLRPSTIYLGSSPRHITLLKSLQKKDPKTVTSTLKSLPDLLTSSSPAELRPFLSTFTTLLPNLCNPSGAVPVLLQALKVFKLTLQVVPKMAKILYEGEVATRVLELNFHSAKQVKDGASSITPLLRTTYPSLLPSLLSLLPPNPPIKSLQLLTLFPPSAETLLPLLHPDKSKESENSLLALHLLKPPAHFASQCPPLTESSFKALLSHPLNPSAHVLCTLQHYSTFPSYPLNPPPPQSSLLLLVLLSYKKNFPAHSLKFSEGLTETEKVEASAYTSNLVKCSVSLVVGSDLRWKLSEYYPWYVGVKILPLTGSYVHDDGLFEEVLGREEVGDEVVVFMWESFKETERGRRRQYVMRGGEVWKELDFSGFYWGGEGWECTLSDLESVKGQASYSNINYCRLLIEEGRIDLGLVKELEKGMRGLILERVIEDRDVCEYVVDHYEDNEDFWALNYSHIKHKVPPLSVCEKAVAHGSFETLLESKKLYPATSFKCHDWSTFLSSKSPYSNSYPPSLIHSVIKDNLKSLPPSLIKYLPLDLRSPLILDSLSRLSSTTLKQAYTLPTYSTGSVVLCKRNATVVRGVVKTVHRDSMPLLYYTVSADGLEFQTDKISDLPVWGERQEVEEGHVVGCIERIEEEGATECLRVLMEFYKGRKGLGSLHARIREAILKIDGEKIGKAFLGLGGKWGVGWAKIVDDVEKFVEEVLEKVGRGSNEILGDASFWVGEERLKDIIKSVNLNLKSNAMNVNNFKLGLQHALKVQRSLSRNKFPNITNPDLSAVKSVVKLFVRDPNAMKDVCFEFFKVGKLRDSEFERHIVSSVKSNSDGLLKLLGSNEVGHLAYKFLDVHARLADVKGEDVTDDEFKRIRANVEERFGGWEVEEREEVEEVVQWAVGVLPRGLREVFEGEEGISCVVDSKKPAANQDPEPAAETAEEKIEEMVAKTQTFILLTTYAERSPKTAQYCNFAGDGVDKILNLLASLVEPGLETETWIKCLDFHDADCSSETYLQNLSNLAFLKSLTTRLVKSWYDSVRNKENKLNAEEFVVLRGRKVVVKDEVDNILKAGRAKLGDMNVEGNIASGEITARYMQDECALSVTVILPKTYPLADARIDTANSLEVPGKKWGLALSCMLKAGSCILDALLLWKDNIDCEFTGVEPCPICYAVLDPKTRCVPGLECGTCHTKFHRGCLVKWFAQSGKEACVICQQETVNIGGGRRGKR